MTGREFGRIRESLGLSEAELAAYLGYTGPRAKFRIVEMERESLPIPRHLVKLMRAYAEGYRPKGGFGV